MVITSVKPAPTQAGPATGSIAHAAEILMCLSGGIHKVSDIARRCNFSKSTVHRVLKLLEQSQLVVEDTINHRYYLGLLIAKLATNAITTHQRLITYADAEMQRLSSVSEETVSLDILSGIQYLQLHQVASQHNLRVSEETRRINSQFSRLFAGASVKVLLAQLDEPRLQLLLGTIKLPAVTERTVTDKKLLLTQLADIRKKGYAISRGERVPGAVCICVPITRYVLPLSLSVVGPELRLQSKLKEVFIELKTSSERIARNIEGIFGRANPLFLK